MEKSRAVARLLDLKSMDIHRYGKDRKGPSIWALSHFGGNPMFSHFSERIGYKPLQ